MGLLGAGALVASAALAELALSVSAEAGLSVMGGPIAPHMARPEPEAGETDQVTSASMDAVTGASRLASTAGLRVDLGRGGLGTLSFGLEHVHYAFTLDYEQGHADVTILALRLALAARLPLLVVRGLSVLTFGFGGYLELTYYDEAALSGSWVDLEVAPIGAGLALELRVAPYRFALPGEAGSLVPGLYARACRGLLGQLRDELGSDAPLGSIAVGLELRYELPPSWLAPAAP